MLAWQSLAGYLYAARCSVTVRKDGLMGQITNVGGVAVMIATRNKAVLTLVSTNSGGSNVQ